MMNDSLPPSSKERSQTPPATNCVSAMFTINQLKRKFDSVDNIMDRIDAGISTLRKIEVGIFAFGFILSIGWRYAAEAKSV